MGVIKVKQENGEVKEFDSESIVEAEGYLPADQVEENYVKEDYFQSEIKRRVGSAKNNKEKELKNDEEFLQKAVRSIWGLDFEDGKPKTGSDVDVEELRKDIRESIREDEVEPYKDENQQLRETTLSNATIRAGNKHGIKKEKLEEAYKGKSLLELKALENFEYDRENGQWALKKPNGDGYEITSKSDSKYPYVTPEEWVEKLRKTHKDWFKDNTQDGSGFNGGGSGAEAESEFEKKKQKVAEIRGK